VLELVFVFWEYRDELHDFRRGVIHAPEKPRTVLFVLGLFGAGLVAGGVSGELWKESQIARVETCIRKGNDSLFLLLSKEAGDAKKSAQSAAAALHDVEQQSYALTLRLKMASEKLGDIEEATLAQGPRSRLLERGKDVFIKALKPFAGQRVTVVICGNGDVERTGLEQLIINMFREAGWDSPGYTRWSGCPNMLTGGNEIFFVAATDDSAEWAGMSDQQWAKPECGRFNISHDAVNTLCDVLYKLRIFTIAWREKPLPEEVGIQLARTFFGFNNASDGPAEMAYKDPGRIFLLVGPSAPMFVDKSKHPHKTAKPK
jgi:hypothetical protein